MALSSSFVGITGTQVAGVTDNLLVYLDAGASVSYPGTGTAWSDLSGNANNGTLNNAPTYESANRGAFIFNGTTNEVTLASNYPSVVNNFSAEVWCRPSTTINAFSPESNSGTDGIGAGGNIINAQQGPDAGFGLAVGTNGVVVIEHGGSYMPTILVAPLTITSITQIVIVYTNKQPSLYINGVLTKTGLTSTRTNVSLNGGKIGSGSYTYWVGRLYALKYYDRSISASEVTQNFNSLRTRYGV
jgi:hypothetical protein